MTQTDIVYGVFVCFECAKLRTQLLPGPHLSMPFRVKLTSVLEIPQTEREYEEVRHEWTQEHIIRLCRLGNLRVQMYDPLVST